MMVTPALLALPPRDLDTLATALRTSRLGPTSGQAELQAFFGQSWAAQIATDLRALAALGFSGTQLACLIELIAQARTAQANTRGLIDLVTTGPLPSVQGDTRVVVQRLFYEAKHSIFIAGYEFYKSEPVFRALANRMAAEPGLQVRFCVNLSPAASGGEAAAIQMFLAEFQKSHWPAGCPLPIFYYDPRTIVQLKQLNQPHPGFYVSQSPAFDRTPPIHLWDQNIYLDASEVPYSVVPRLHGVRLGDFGLVICNSTGQATPFLYGDASGSTAGSLALGECSGYIYETIGNGNNDQTFSFIAFPGTGSGVADQNAVAKLESTVRALMGKISDDDDSISARLANDEWQYRDLSLAVYHWGGPYFMGHRAHGGPETRAEDFPDGL